MTDREWAIFDLIEKAINQTTETAKGLHNEWRKSMRDEDDSPYCAMVYGRWNQALLDLGMVSTMGAAVSRLLAADEAEEAGELCRELNERNFGRGSKERVIAEAVRVAAVAVSIMEQYDTAEMVTAAWYAYRTKPAPPEEE